MTIKTLSEFFLTFVTKLTGGLEANLSKPLDSKYIDKRSVFYLQRYGIHLIMDIQHS